MNAVTTEFTALDYLSSSTFGPNYSQVLVALTAFSSASPLAGSLVLGISGAVCSISLHHKCCSAPDATIVIAAARTL
jgi:hypothetical protein